MLKITLAVATIVFAAWFALTQTDFKLGYSRFGSGGENAMTVGSIVAFSGEVTARAAGSRAEERLSHPRPLRARETLVTGPESTLTLNFPGGGQIRLLENSRLAAEPTSDGAQVTILNGQFEFLQPGTGESLHVYKDGRRVRHGTDLVRMPPSIVSGPDSQVPVPAIENDASNEDALITPTAQDETSALQASPPADPPITSTPNNTERTDTNTLTNEQIQRLLAAQGPRFQRCFLDFMKRANSTSANGVVTTSFIIRPNGKVDSLRVTESTFTDPLLNSCVIEVVDRTPFPEFDGEPILISEYPIRFQ